MICNPLRHFAALTGRRVMNMNTVVAAARSDVDVDDFYVQQECHNNVYW